MAVHKLVPLGPTIPISWIMRVLLPYELRKDSHVS